jgi:hypothetical protein
VRAPLCRCSIQHSSHLKFGNTRLMRGPQRGLSSTDGICMRHTSAERLCASSTVMASTSGSALAPSLRHQDCDLSCLAAILSGMNVATRLGSPTSWQHATFSADQRARRENVQAHLYAMASCGYIIDIYLGCPRTRRRRAPNQAGKSNDLSYESLRRTAQPQVAGSSRHRTRLIKSSSWAIIIAGYIQAA